MIVVDHLNPAWGEDALALWMLKKVDPRRYSAETLTAYLGPAKLAEAALLFDRPATSIATYEHSPRPARNEEFLYVHAGAVYSVVVR